MNATFSVFNLVTGVLTGQTISVPPDALAANTPEGFGLTQGAWDSSRWRVDLSSGQLVPTSDSGRPADTPEITWSWSDEAARWVPAATLLKERSDRLALVDRAILQAEAGTDRALRDLVIAAGLPLAAVARMQAIEASVASLRAVRQQLLDAATMEALLAVEIPDQP